MQANCCPFQESSSDIAYIHSGNKSVYVCGLLPNTRPQLRDSGATEKVVMLTKQTKIGLCEQVRVN
jgi:hypothetical protein